MGVEGLRMSYYTSGEMITLFQDYPQLIDQLYIRGFLITNVRQKELSEYPFYGNWREETVKTGEVAYYMYLDNNPAC